jgi:hypothetical protein
MSASTRGIASPTSTGAAAHVCDVIPSRNFIFPCERRTIVNRGEHIFELKSVLHWEDKRCEQITGMLAHDSHPQDPDLVRGCAELEETAPSRSPQQHGQIQPIRIA